MQDLRSHFSKFFILKNGPASTQSEEEKVNGKISHLGGEAAAAQAAPGSEQRRYRRPTARPASGGCALRPGFTLGPGAGSLFRKDQSP